MSIDSLFRSARKTKKGFTLDFIDVIIDNKESLIDIDNFQNEINSEINILNEGINKYTKENKPKIVSYFQKLLNEDIKEICEEKDPYKRIYLLLKYDVKFLKFMKENIDDMDF